MGSPRLGLGDSNSDRDWGRQGWGPRAGRRAVQTPWEEGVPSRDTGMRGWHPGRGVPAEGEHEVTGRYEGSASWGPGKGRAEESLA